MHYERRFALRREMSTFLVWVMLLVFTVVFLVSVWQLIGDVRGATVDAAVVSIRTDGPGRRVYDIRLVTRSGRTCVTEVDSGSNPPPRGIRVGGTSRVHYSAENTCAGDSVRESTNPGPGDDVGFLSLVIAICLFALWRERKH